MSRWDQRYLGFERFPDALSLHEIERYFTPTSEEITVIHERRVQTAGVCALCIRERVDGGGSRGRWLGRRSAAAREGRHAESGDKHQ